MSSTDMGFQIASVPEILAELRQGRMVIIVDDKDRENEGDLVLATDYVTPEAINFMATHARGLVCITITKEQAERLELTPMSQKNGTKYGTNFTVSIEAATGVTTGISAADRAVTIRAACNPNAKAQDIVTPGHIFPCRAVPGGTLIRAGHTEAGCDLTKLAGLTPSAVICEIMNEDGTMSRLPDLIGFAQTHGLKIGSIADLIQYRIEHESMVDQVGSKVLETPWGAFTAVAFQDRAYQNIHLALVHGELSPEKECLVRVHEPTSLLDVLDTQNGGQHSWGIGDSLKAIQAHGAGALVMMNCQSVEGDLLGEIRGWSDDSAAPVPPTDHQKLRNHGIGAQILRALSLGRIKILGATRKMPSMAGYGLTITGFVSNGE